MNGMNGESTRVARIELPDGTPVWARISGAEELSYTDTGFHDRVEASVESLHSLITGVARSLSGPLSAVRPDEVSVEFGIELTAKAGKVVGLLADGEAKAALTVTLTWNGGPPEPGPVPGAGSAPGAAPDTGGPGAGPSPGGPGPGGPRPVGPEPGTPLPGPAAPALRADPDPRPGTADPTPVPGAPDRTPVRGVLSPAPVPGAPHANPRPGPAHPNPRPAAPNPTPVPGPPSPTPQSPAGQPPLPPAGRHPLPRPLPAPTPRPEALLGVWGHPG